MNEATQQQVQEWRWTGKRYGWLIAVILLVPLTMGVLYGVHKAEVSKARQDYLDCRLGNSSLGADPDTCVPPIV